MNPHPKTNQYFTALKTHKSKFSTVPKHKINPRNRLRNRKPQNVQQNEPPFSPPDKAGSSTINRLTPNRLTDN